jgi:hypothetical protein
LDAPYRDHVPSGAPAVTVRLFVGTDPEHRNWEPDYTHEAEAALRVAGKVWRVLHAARELYLLAFNLHQPNADLLVICERGIGVAEMKSHHGPITFGEGDQWLAAGRPMVGYRAVSAKDHSPSTYLNPHAQVQGHGARVHERCSLHIKETYPDLSRGKRRALRLQTTVCFTNPDADLTQLRAGLGAWCRGRLQSWESDFTVTTPEELPAWIAALRFEVKLQDTPPYYPFRLDPARMESMLQCMHPVERWASAERMLPAIRYGCLVRMEEGRALGSHMLWEEETRIGRDSVLCTLVVPPACTRVSRQHAIIRRVGNRVLLQDLGSNNGTYIDDVAVKGEQPLADGARITLGGRSGTTKECLFVFRRIENAEDGCDSTEDATRPSRQ